MTLVDATGAKILKVAVCIPCQDVCNSGFALDLARMVKHTSLLRPDIELSLIQNRGTIIPQQRAVLVRAAMESNATHVLWLDSDMRFPHDILLQLLDRGCAIVAVNYARRRKPILPTAEHAKLGFLFTTDDSDGLVEVSQCGMGIMLVDMAVYTQIPQPWFAIGFNPRDAEYTGEDFFFCRKAREHGFATMIDQDASKQVRHVGEMEFTAEHTVVTRDAYTQES
jgi:hypothetical protein